MKAIINMRDAMLMTTDSIQDYKIKGIFKGMKPKLRRRIINEHLMKKYALNENELEAIRLSIENGKWGMKH